MRCSVAWEKITYNGRYCCCAEQQLNYYSKAKSNDMKKIKVLQFGIAAILLLCAVFVGCQEKGKSINSVHQGDFKVELLFEKNGCKMYRFLDGYRYIYWSDCQGKTQSDYITQSGKITVTHHEETVTSK
jgi:hypothetical protein